LNRTLPLARSIAAFAERDVALGTIRVLPSRSKG